MVRANKSLLPHDLVNRLLSPAVIVFALTALPLVVCGVVGWTIISEFRPTSFNDVSGYTARKKLTALEEWPPDVAAEAVDSLSYHSERSIDSYSKWLHVLTNASSADQWIDHWHSRQRFHSLSVASIGKEVEGVTRSHGGTIPVNSPTGKTPAWWNPVPGRLRRTEAMLWYTDGPSGVARGTYTVYDTRTKSLWLYEFAAQGHELWQEGDAPVGDGF